MRPKTLLVDCRGDAGRRALVERAIGAYNEIGGDGPKAEVRKPTPRPKAATPASTPARCRGDRCAGREAGGVRTRAALVTQHDPIAPPEPHELRHVTRARVLHGDDGLAERQGEPGRVGGQLRRRGRVRRRHRDDQWPHGRADVGRADAASGAPRSARPAERCPPPTASPGARHGPRHPLAARWRRDHPRRPSTARAVSTGHASSCHRRPLGMPRRSTDDEDEVDDDGNGAIDFEAGHGTFIAGVVRQLCPDAEIYNAGVLSSFGDGDVFGVLDTWLAVLAADRAGRRRRHELRAVLRRRRSGPLRAVSPVVPRRRRSASLRPATRTRAGRTSRPRCPV